MRTHPPIRHCPDCGIIVNGRAQPLPCDATIHAERRKRRAGYCTDCGGRLAALGR